MIFNLSFELSYNITDMKIKSSSYSNWYILNIHYFHLIKPAYFRYYIHQEVAEFSLDLFPMIYSIPPNIRSVQKFTKTKSILHISLIICDLPLFWQKYKYLVNKDISVNLTSPNSEGTSFCTDLMYLIITQNQMPFDSSTIKNQYLQNPILPARNDVTRILPRC